MSKLVICRDCEVEFEIPKQRGRPAVRCEPCRSKNPSALAFALNGAIKERTTEVIDGVTWVESANPCEGCSKVFMRIKKKGRPPKKCMDCTAWDDAAKAAQVTVSEETLEELFKGDKELLKGTPDALPKGAESQCPPLSNGCGRIWTSDSACEEHKSYGPKGFTCKDPATLGHEPRERRGIPVWTRPYPKKEEG